MTLAALDLQKHLPATITAPGLTEAEFLDLCSEFPDCFLEYTTDGTVLIMPPPDPETSAGVARIVKQLGNWSDRDGRGIVMGPDGGFFLPDGSRRSPDAAWFDAARWRAAKMPQTRFPVFAPEFLIEVRSAQQRAVGLREKMLEYIANGVQLGWLIDPQERTVTIYRPGGEAEVLSAPSSVSGEGPIGGFILHLDGIL
ncbi:MAG TPA: Uma2 family endonuclease [Bryobacteraceae bacterium]|jgi:Uma2 family endonuclease